MRAKPTIRRRATTCTTSIRCRTASGSMAFLIENGDTDARRQSREGRSGLYADRTADRARDYRVDADARVARVFSFDRFVEGEGARAEPACHARGDRSVLRRPGALSRFAAGAGGQALSAYTAVRSGGRQRGDLA